MNVTQSLKHIDRAVIDVLESREAYDDASDGPSLRRAYRRSIETLRDEASAAEAKQLARWIEDAIREERKLPSRQRVREEGERIRREAGGRVA